MPEPRSKPRMQGRRAVPARRAGRTGPLRAAAGQDHAPALSPDAPLQRPDLTDGGTARADCLIGAMVQISLAIAMWGVIVWSALKIIARLGG